jgi:hypothetical protein
LEHKVEVGGKEYVLNRPVISVERKVRALASEMSEKMPGIDSEEGFSELKRLWREIATLTLKEPDEDVLDFGNVTDGETADICADFFAAARKTKERPPVG